MSLSAQDQQALDSITDRLAGSDPELAALLTGFTRLASGQEMPQRERIRAGSRPAIRCPGRQRQRRRAEEVRRPAGPVSRRLGLQWAGLLLSLLTAVTVIAVVMAVNHGKSHGACATFWDAACADSAPAHTSGPASQKTVTHQAAHQRTAGT